MEAVNARLSLCSFLLVALTASVHADITQLSKADRTALEHPATIKMLFSTTHLPSAVTAVCAGVTSDHQFWLANPGQRFQETDVVIGLWRLPARRLIWIAQLPNYFVVHYEYGGLGLSNHILVVHRGAASRKPGLVWAAAGDRYRQLRGIHQGDPKQQA